MITSLFHRWEQRLASVDADRVVRPFDWGLDWIPDQERRPGATPIEILGDFADKALADSDAFFDAPPISDYTWLDARDEAGDGTRTLFFPSAIVTPHPENNTVYARYFQASTRARRAAETSVRRAVLVLPQWNADAGGHVGLCRILAHVGLSALRLSLPYHDRRMPPSLQRADYIVSSNVGRTVQVCRQAVVDARRAIAWLAGQGYERIGILGTSLGSCLSMLTTAHEPLIRAEALNHISQFFADPVWEGLSTAHVRAGFDGHITLEELRRCWMPISPQAYVERVRDRRTLLVYARYDLTFPVHLSLNLVNEFRRRRIPHMLAVLPCGHYTSGATPFKYLDAYYLTSFLLRNL
jgi:hypothetical protein